jgi:tetratricopeptide (TPR) repeat protein
MDESYTTELLVRYLDGELTAEQSAAIEARLASEPALQQELDELRLAIQAVSLVSSEHTVGRIHQQMITERNSRKRKVVPMFSRLSSRVAVAAVVIVALGFGWWVMNTGTEAIRDGYFVPYSVSVSRGSESAGSVEEMFSKGDHSSVIQFSQSNRVAGRDSLLVALSMLELGKYRESAEWLTALQNVADLKADADYYLGFAYLGMGDRRMALKVFESIKKDSTHLYHSMVSDGMLRKIRFRSW